MTDKPVISREIYDRLQTLAADKGCSPDELLAQLLDSEIGSSDSASGKQAEQALWESENRLRQAMNLAHLGIWEWDIETDKTTWHGDMFRIYGIAPEDFTGKGSDYIEFTREDYRDAQRENIGKAFEKGVSEEQLRQGVGIAFDPKELCIVRPDGTEAYTIGDAVAITDDAGNPKLMIGVSMDITERKLMEVALRQSEARYRALFNDLLTPIIVYDDQTRFVLINDLAASNLGSTPEKIVGTSLKDHLPEIFDTIQARIQDVLSSQKIVYAEDYVELGTGSHWFWSVFQPIFDNGQDAHKVQVISYDITDRKQAEAALRESEARYRALFNASIHPIVVYDEHANFVMINEVGARNLGGNPEDIIGKSVGEFIPAIVDTTVQRIQQATTTQEAMFVEDQVSLANGNRWFWTVVQPVFTNDDTPRQVQMMSYDITERKQAEEALRQSEARLRSLVETQSAFVVRTEVNGKCTYANQAFIQEYGWLYQTAENDDNIVGAPVLLTVDKADHDQVSEIVRTCIKSPGEPVQVSLRMRQEDGDFSWTLWEFVAIPTIEGAISEVQCIGFDITERKHSEQLSLENERLKALFEQEQSQNALIQQTISALSHDLRTPLTVISTAKDILSRHFDQLSAEKRQQKIDSIERQLQYALELLDDTVQVVKGNLSQREFDPAPVNLAALCQVSVEEIIPEENTKHHLHFTNAGNVGVVSIDEILISRILLNLLSNAIKYSPDGGDIWLELDRRDEWIVLRVVDQGIGIGDDDLPHIFEPFYRADSALKIGGTGLGLSIVKDCVERHQGRTHVMSHVGQGTTFTVELPIIPEAITTD